jgi:hypothetical protein
MEIGTMNPQWRTSSYSTGNGGECIEAGHTSGAILVRDTKDKGTGPVLRVKLADWARFTRGIKG